MLTLALPSLSALVSACAEGRYEQEREVLERHLADHPDDKLAAFLLRFLAAAALDPRAARAALEGDRAAAEEEVALLSAMNPVLICAAYDNRQLRSCGSGRRARRARHGRAAGGARPAGDRAGEGQR